MSGTSKAIFVSYASEDAEAARRICSGLRAAGIEVWFDQSELRGGDAWDRTIRQQIHECTLFVALISGNSQARLEGYFRREWKLAVDRTHDMAEEKAFLIPVVIDGTSERDASVPEKFRELQWFRLPGGEVTPPFVSRVQGLLGAEPAAAPADDVPAPHRRPHPSGHRRRAARWHALLVPALAIMAVVGAFLWRAGGHPVHGRVAVAGAEKSIAVLPFTDMSERHDQEYFGDGMAEEILDLLTKIPGLTVIGRTSSFRFKGKYEDLRAIGAQLDAAYVLEGSVRRSGDQVRITAQLINTRTGTHAWSDTYDRHIDDVLKLEDIIAASVVRELQLTVASDGPGSRAAASDPEVYDLILRGRHAADRLDAEGVDRAVTLFQEALTRDPKAAAAAAGLAYAFIDQVMVGSVAPKAGFERARQAATDALRLDPKTAKPHLSLALIHIFYDWDWAAAERELQAAATLAPGSVELMSVRATLSSLLGHDDEALRQIKDAIAQDPLNALFLQLLSNMYLSKGNLSEAEAAMRRALDIRPMFAYGHFDLGIVCLMRGDFQGALREFQLESVDDGKEQGLALAYHALGRKTDADAVLASLIEKQATRNALDIAQVYAFRGQADDAMHWLERAYTQKDPYLYQINGSFLMKNIAADPRYRAFLRKMNFPD